MRLPDGTNLTALSEYLLAGLDRDAREALHRQLYRALRAAILAGKLPAGSTLPASRGLAEELGLGRNTVLHAYEQLCAEGYCHGRGGAGTFVTAVLPEAVPERPPSPARQQGTPGLSSRARQLLPTLTRRAEPAGPAFMPGLPDLAAFPWTQWQRHLHQRQRASSPADFDYRTEGGHAELKTVLAEHLRLSRAVDCSAEQILITGGMQQTLDLVARAVADAGDVAWMEDPGYLGARTAWQAAGLRVTPLPLDEQGMNWMGADYPKPRLIYVTPSHQYPLGAVMSLARRQSLLAEAARHDAWILEDDYDGEFRHQGRPLAALQGLDRSGRVLYLGTFGKTMFPALRLGYLVAPIELVDPLRRLQARLYRESDYVVQAALADFIGEGHFGSHLRKMRTIYARRQAKLRDTLCEQLGGALPLLGGEAGMHVCARLPPGSDDLAISALLASAGITAQPLTPYCQGQPPFPGLVLGYAGVDDATLRLAAVKMAAVLRGML
ncbi:PLP-dependent aminotransferase family protein [Chitinimonas arctica]|uniref:Putative 8-amino-7-oxononanoate synthase n=1 Tax=Chitinimonas arctica TaxID=2594795 RepID=A0A516SD92_9NEIS|nr:PLP-dependent aminotransferase family protein [Chitinimonas arctica]QDQ26125.1 PLP-dependent aminotransferase family protein [Chitinimonas arctica]